MIVAAWLVIGLVVGFVASQMAETRDHRPLPDIVVGLIGSVVGGLLYSWSQGAGFSVVGALAALVAGILALMLYHVVTRRR
jgi:uncharacterized membrane protein YeaQ/YmgE (transglycosylase-associated protein family)